MWSFFKRKKNQSKSEAVIFILNELFFPPQPPGFGSQISFNTLHAETKKKYFYFHMVLLTLIVKVIDFQMKNPTHSSVISIPFFRKHWVNH